MRNILGGGCDSFRAPLAKRKLEPLLKCNIDPCTSNAQLLTALTSGKKYDVFFIPPGFCSLIKSGKKNADEMIHLVQSYHPHIQIVMIEDNSQGEALLREALARCEREDTKNNDLLT